MDALETFAKKVTLAVDGIAHVEKMDSRRVIEITAATNEYLRQVSQIIAQRRKKVS